jgi:hypothetical protein
LFFKKTGAWPIRTNFRRIHLLHETHKTRETIEDGGVVGVPVVLVAPWALLRWALYFPSFLAKKKTSKSFALKNSKPSEIYKMIKEKAMKKSSPKEREIFFAISVTSPSKRRQLRNVKRVSEELIVEVIVERKIGKTGGKVGGRVRDIAIGAGWAKKELTGNCEISHL